MEQKGVFQRATVGNDEVFARVYGERSKKGEVRGETGDLKTAKALQYLRKRSMSSNWGPNWSKRISSEVTHVRRKSLAGYTSR